MVLNLLFLPWHIVLYLNCAPPGKGKYAKAGGILLLCSLAFCLLVLRDSGAMDRFNYPSSWGEWSIVSTYLFSQGFNYANNYCAACFGPHDALWESVSWQIKVTCALLIWIFGYELLSSFRQHRCRYTLFVPLLMVGYAAGWLVFSVTVKPLSLVYNSSSLWPLISLALAQAMGGSGLKSRVIRWLFLLLLLNNIPMIWSDPFVGNRHTTRFANVLKTGYRSSDIAIIHDHKVIEPYWLSGFTTRDQRDNFSSRLCTATHFTQNIAQGSELRPRQISASTNNLMSLSALVLENSHTGQRVWIVGRNCEFNPTRIHAYIRWYISSDIKCLAYDAEDVFVMCLVK